MLFFDRDKFQGSILHVCPSNSSANDLTAKIHRRLSHDTLVVRVHDPGTEKQLIRRPLKEHFQFEIKRKPSPVRRKCGLALMINRSLKT